MVLKAIFTFPVFRTILQSNQVSSVSRANTDNKKLSTDEITTACNKTKHFCITVEKYTKKILALEVVQTLLVAILSSLQSNPFLLQTIVQKQNLSDEQAVLVTSYWIANYVRTSVCMSILFSTISWLTICLLVVDLLYGFFLWQHTKKEALYILYGISKTRADAVAKSILMSLSVLPMSSYGCDRYRWCNSNKPSYQIDYALSISSYTNIQPIIASGQITSLQEHQLDCAKKLVKKMNK
ncbi:hypothetical protein RFI_23739 [Reticulomyxa filosa]|uniref:Uncharacterized protein n=1 Tax=Reticulomyxa filosa TaxID=46433 RepID=X6MKL9_RETFI|nr:hypothetical protein RFI_23739 [Reticulomyxa filosa]|eukprot:ETO13630.1 hypothetical protein RFI_23739 [Reticulomyxa filosa]